VIWLRKKTLNRENSIGDLPLTFEEINSLHKIEVFTIDLNLSLLLPYKVLTNMSTYMQLQDHAIFYHGPLIFYFL